MGDLPHAKNSHFDKGVYDPIAKYYIIALLFIIAIHFVLAASAPPAPDEAYYWLWSRNLQPGYYDHPPMVAFWIRAGELMVGHGALGIRLFAPLASALGSMLLWRAAEDFFPGRSTGFVAFALYNATLIGGVCSIIMTPDAPLLLFWTASIAALGRWLATRDNRWWIAFGLAVGAALLSKYTAAFLVVAVGMWLLTTPVGREALRTPWPWAAFALALAMFAPNIGWNAAHGWVSYLKQGSRLALFDPSRAYLFLPDFALNQIGLATPLVFWLAAIGTWRVARNRGAEASLLTWLTLTPTAVFAEHAVFDQVQGQWAAIVYPSACIAAAGLPSAFLAKWLKWALALGFGVTLAVYAQVFVALLPIPPRHDPVALQLAGWPEFVTAVADRTPHFITSDGYATLAEIAYYAPPGVAVVGVEPRWAYFDMASAQSLSGATGLMVGEGKDPNSPCKDTHHMLDRRRDTKAVWAYRLCDVVAPATGVLLPGN